MKRTALAEAYASTRQRGTASLPRSAENGGVAISCYENDVPTFVEAELERIYGSLYSSLVQYRIYSNGRDTSTYIVRDGERIVTVFLFQHEGKIVRVLNEVISVGEEDIEHFARYVFSAFPDVSVVTFKAIHHDIRRLSFPYQRHNHLEDVVLTMPRSADEYLNSLGKNTRRHIRRYIRKLDESLPGWQYKAYVGEEITEEIVRVVIEMNHARMAGKNKTSAIDPQEAERIFRMARECGMIGTVQIGGRICAGTVTFRVGGNYFLNVLAHDPKYDEYWLGTLGCYFTICEAIARGGREFHFLWGRYDYKYQLLGRQRDLDNVAIYRSSLHKLKNARVGLRMALNGLVRNAKLRVHAAKKEGALWARLTAAGVDQLRGLKRTA